MRARGKTEMDREQKGTRKGKKEKKKKFEKIRENREERNERKSGWVYGPVAYIGYIKEMRNLN